jgi:hypothetical protein
MVDASVSRQKAQAERAAGVHRQLPLFATGLAVILIGLGWVLLQRGFAGNSPPASSIIAAASERVAKELLETTKGLQATQQQAVDQLQIVQDQLIAQKAESKKLSEQIATVTEQLQALQQSVANISATAAAPPVSPKSGR